MMSLKEIVQNSAMLIGFLGICYVAARIAGSIGAAWAARRLAPLAPTVKGQVDPKRGVLLGTYGGRRIRVTYSPKETVGSGEAQSHIKAFHITVLDLPGKADWWLQYHVSGLLGQGPKQLRIGTRKLDGLAERLASTGVIAAVEACNAGSDTYMAVRYESFFKTLTYTDDVSPRELPTIPVFERQLQIAVRLAAINEAVNG